MNPALSPEYTGTFAQYYPRPLTAEAEQCKVGAEIIVDQQLLKNGSGILRRARVISIWDTPRARIVIFKERT